MSIALASRQPLLAHLLELRRRLLWSSMAFGLAAVAAYIYHQSLITFLLKPLHEPVYYTTPQGGFEFLLRISSTLGLIVVIPILAYQLIKFIEPALHFRFARRYLMVFLSSSLLLLVLGVAFAYIVMLPMTLHFFGSFGNAQIKPLIAANDYLSLVIGLFATFAIIFQLPLVFLVIDRITPLTPGKLMKYQKHVVIGSLVVALILPFTYDPITQFIMAAPIVILYELSIILIWYINRRRVAAARTVAAPVMETLAPEFSPSYSMSQALDMANHRQLLGPRVLDLRPKS